MEKKFEYGFYSKSITECVNRFGSIFDLPIIKEPYTEAIKYYSGGNILDLGAGREKLFQSFTASIIGDGVYYSLDNDPSGEFSFRNISDIPNDLKFKFIFANQFFEHLNIEDSLVIFKKLYNLLEIGAQIFVTVPNISHPNRQISHIDHKTGWGYSSLYMLYRYGGFDVTQIARYSKRHPQGMIEKTLAKYISRIYRMDWCDSVMIIGQKNAQ